MREKFTTSTHSHSHAIRIQSSVNLQFVQVHVVQFTNSFGLFVSSTGFDFVHGHILQKSMSQLRHFIRYERVASQRQQSHLTRDAATDNFSKAASILKFYEYGQNRIK